MTSAGRGFAGRGRPLIGAIALGLATAAAGTAFLAMSKPPAPTRRIALASIVDTVAPRETRVALPAAPPQGEFRVASLTSEPVSLADETTVAETPTSPPPPTEGPTPDPSMDEVNQYLWGVYERTAVKHDGTGDFTWKDIAAAERLGMTLGDYVIVGMDADFREILYRAGRAMDAAGFRWTILSAFRDDYRQGLASGYKARIGNSLHGGSLTTGGYGHGCAVDITDADGRAVPLWQWVDANRAQVNIERPLPGIDPAHMQPRGPWHELAAALRQERLAPPEAQISGSLLADAAADAPPPEATASAPSEADLACIGLHHHHLNEPAVADSSSPRSRHFHSGAGAREAKNETKGDAKSTSKAAIRAADAEKTTPRTKAGGHGLARHALHGSPREAGPA